MAKRFAAVLLSVCMLIGMILPMSAVGGQTVKKDVAFDSTTNTATITLTIPGGTPPAMNVIFVLDNSSSMKVKVGDKSRMKLAIEAAEQFIGSRNCRGLCAGVVSIFGRRTGTRTDFCPRPSA